jgi:hypothetical protein
MSTHRKSKPRLVEGVGPGGLLPGESRVTDWPGGELRVVVRQPKVIEGVSLNELPTQETEWQRGAYVPFGEGLALPQPLKTELVQVGLEVEVAIRNGRPRCIGLRSLDTGPPITTTLLKSAQLPAIGKVVRDIVADKAVRLVRTAEGEVIGLHSWSTGDPRSTYQELTADIERAIDDLEGSEQRWRLTEEHLEEVATVYKDAHAKGASTARAIAQRWHTTEENARRWVMRARAKGHLPKTEQRKARNSRAGKENDG